MRVVAASGARSSRATYRSFTRSPLPEVDGEGVTHPRPQVSYRRWRNVRPLTQTAPDGESEAEQEPSLGEKLQVRAVTRGAPGRIRTCGTRFRSFSWAGP
ncbi:hypothetical protein ALMP_32960 [Streptomyces sp. A012304]|nr:hypothetical protein ALMP_32960 [Streptomyces sp. A012304]